MYNVVKGKFLFYYEDLIGKERGFYKNEIAVQQF
jgi:hypothetical protein